MKRIHEKDLLAVSDTLYPHGRLINAKRLEGGFSCDVFTLDIQTAHKESKLVFRSEGSYPADNSIETEFNLLKACLLYTSPSPRDRQKSRMPSSA